MSNEVILSEATFEQEVLQSTQPVLVDFWAPWCGPCMMLGPTIEEIAKDFAGKAKVCKLNTDENEAIAAKYQINAIPSLLFFKGGQLVDKSVGVANKKAIADKLTKLL
ncbi:MAG: thioredoxin [bacterium]|nr:thioredoxin [bacterium]MDD5755819.1 thioredoxin [bacterium]